MKEHTDAEIQAKCEAIWKDGSSYLSDWTCEVKRAPEHIDITIKQMYKAPGLSFPRLTALAQFFDTMNVETESEFSHGGCETCDYGSEYGFTLRIRPGDTYTEPTGVKEP